MLAFVEVTDGLLLQKCERLFRVLQKVRLVSAKRVGGKGLKFVCQTIVCGALRFQFGSKLGVKGRKLHGLVAQADDLCG